MRCIFFIYLFYSVAAAGQSYSVALLPDSLIKKADAVLRVDETKITIHSIAAATVKKKICLYYFK